MRRQSARLIAGGRAWWTRSIGGRSFSRMRELDLDTHALALCAQQVLCTAPLIVAMSAVLQRFSGRNASFVISKFFGLHGESARDISRLFGRTSNHISTLALIVGLITAIAFTTSVAAVQQRAFEMIWTLPRVSGIRSWARQLVWTPALVAFTVFVLIAGRLGRWLDKMVIGIGPWMVVLLHSVVIFFFYWWTQHWLLRSRVEWRALVPGALAVAVLTTAMVRISRYIMHGQISWQVDAYGLVGAVFVLSVWLMVLSALIFTGILVGALYMERRRRPGKVPPALEIAHSPLTIKGLRSAAAANAEHLHRHHPAVAPAPDIDHDVLPVDHAENDPARGEITAAPAASLP